MEDYATSGSEIEAMMNDLLMSKYLDNESPSHAEQEKQTKNIDKLVFGRTEPVNTLRDDPAPLEVSTETPLPAKLDVSGLPEVSRVENQLKLKLKLTFTADSPIAHKDMVHLPADCIAKEKLFLANDNLEQLSPALRHRMLRLDAALVCAGTHRNTYVCDRCMQREQRRASRRKSGLSDNMLWCNNPRRSPIIFKNKQVFPVPSGSRTADSVTLDLVARIVCYSRHHGANDGFKVVFTVRDVEDDTKVLAYAETHPIIIVDKKQPGSGATNTQAQGEKDAAAPPSMAEFFSASKLFLSSPSASDSQQQLPGGNTQLHAPPFPSPSSLSEDDSTALSTSHKRARNSIDSNSSWSNTNTNSISNSNNNSVNNFSFDALSNLYMGAPPAPQPDANAPLIQRIIPAQGTINGGIEITLLGKNLKQGQVIKFGDNIALSTQCWNDSTMVTYLPPASSAGQVVVTIEDRASNSHMNLQQLVQPKSLATTPGGAQPFANANAIFTYVDDTDRQLIELALQIVGLKMNGKLEDARNIAKRIVGSNGSTPGASGTSNNSTPSESGAYGYALQRADSDEQLLVNVLKSFKVGSRNLNLSVCDAAGRTLLHYAALKGHRLLLRTLVGYGANVEREDKFGYTPIHFACIGGDHKSIDMLYKRCGADPMALTSTGMDGPALLWLNQRVAWEDLYETKESSANAAETNSIHSLSAASSFSNLRETKVPQFTGEGYSNDEEDEFADDEGDTEDEARSIVVPPESESAHSSLWDRMVHRLNENDLLPKYEDLFPKSLLDLNQKANAFLQNDASTTVASVSEEEEEEEDDDDDEDYEEDVRTVVQQFFVEQRTKFRNDSMLLFFWIPLMVILICSMALYNLGSHGNAIQTAGDAVAKYLRMGLSHVILGNERMKAAVMARLQSA